jgi:pyruvate decarboxylase
MGKTAIDESHPQFGGIYVGTITLPEVKEAFESADFILSIGALKTDFNTAVSTLYCCRMLKKASD